MNRLRSNDDHLLLTGDGDGGGRADRMLELGAVHPCISSRRNSRYTAARSDAFSTPANGVT